VLAPPAAADRVVKIKASAPRWTVVRGQIVIQGRVRPYPEGIELTLQQRRTGAWRNAGTRAAQGQGRFVFVAQPRKIGAITYRIVAAKGSGFVGASRKMRVRVLRWSFVGRIVAFRGRKAGMGEVSTRTIVASDVRYRRAVILDAGCHNRRGGRAWVDYAVKKRYKVFTASVALGGAATTGSTARYAVIGGNGKRLASGNLAYGAPAKEINVLVGRFYRLRLWMRDPASANPRLCAHTHTKVVFGDAKLLGP
jgi:hypothetical protein